MTCTEPIENKSNFYLNRRSCNVFALICIYKYLIEKTLTHLLKVHDITKVINVHVM